jgi:hypothetical protein
MIRAARIAMQRVRMAWAKAMQRTYWLIPICGLLMAVPSMAWSEEAQWIWHPDHEKESVPEGACYFRKTFEGPEPEAGQITITADDSYELYVNGRLVGRGNSQKRMDEYDIKRFLNRNGANTIAVRVENQRGNTGGLAARVMVKDIDGPWRSYSTDDSWRTNVRPLPLWNTTLYNDRRWPVAQSFGALGDTAPWDRNEEVPVEEREKSERFQISEEFEVRRVIESDATCSLIAMTFVSAPPTLPPA